MNSPRWITIGLLLVVGCQGPKVTYMPGPPKPPPAPPATKFVAIDQGLRAQAKAALLGSMRSNSAIIRTHAIEAVKQVLPDQKAAILAALDDKAIVVRFAALMAIGDLKIAEARPQLLNLVDDKDGRIQAAVRYALHQLGDYSRTRDLEALSKSTAPQVRSVTALVIGMIGDPSGVIVLKPMLRDKEGFVRLQAAESLWRLGNEEGRDALIGASVSRYADDQMVGTLGLGAKRDKSVRGQVYVNLTAEYEEVKLVAARVMGQLDSDAGYAVATNGAKSSDARQRQLAALALGAIGRSDAQIILRKLLEDGNEDVQVAAALAILQLKDPG